ncbi:hypothetical protein GLOIN_2v1786478 [Rhizophagus irregularis DAOM 181602=DAOM 197198]|nr:hypothetical protein GLOIN_2v1786478 [Rhizophagus irregularis DAOM 181602=DAOM 197198]
MSRKRSVSSILDDLDDEESPSNQPSSTRRNRSISSIINKEIVFSARPTSNKRKLSLQESKESDNSNQDDVDDEYYQDVEFNFLSRQRARNIHATQIILDCRRYHSESDNDPIFGISGIFEDYSPPSYEPFQNPLYLELNYDRFLWMLLWIMNFRTRFNITKTTTETLIKFMKLALYEFSSDNFNDFPDSLYLTRKKLELNDQFHSFVPCLKCHKLYKK